MIVSHVLTPINKNPLSTDMPSRMQTSTVRTIDNLHSSRPTAPQQDPCENETTVPRVNTAGVLTGKF